MKGSGEISTKQQKLLALLLTEATIDKACQKANVAVTTYWRWMRDGTFLAEYRKARRGIAENAVAKLQSITLAAIETLERNLTSGNPNVEIRCAAIILEQSMRGVEMLEIENRLEYLETIYERRAKVG